MVRCFIVAIGLGLLSSCDPDCDKEIGEVECDGYCARLAIDSGNCGACGNVCHGLETCRSGTCRCGAFDTDPASAVCNGECVYIEGDPENCGGCGVECPEDTPFCTEGGCTRCRLDQQCGDHCVEFETDNDNCSERNFQCAEGSVCSWGVCVAPDASCDPPCDADQRELCCADGGGSSCFRIADSDAHCGSCEESCGSGCEQGECDPY